MLPAKHALNGIKAFFEYVGIEQRSAATLGGFPASGIGIDVGQHAAIEDRLSVLPAIVSTVQTDDRSLKLKTNRTSYSHHVWQGHAQKWRFTVVPLFDPLISTLSVSGNKGIRRVGGTL